MFTSVIVSWVFMCDQMYQIVYFRCVPFSECQSYNHYTKKKKSCLSIVRPSSSTKSDSQEALPLHFSGLSDSHHLANTSSLVRAVHALSPRSW